MKSLIAVVFALTTVVGLVSCSDNGQDSSSEIAESEAFNQVDVDFAIDMIQHHTQALAMVDRTVDRELSPELTRHTEEELAEREAAQGGDFEQMWLEMMIEHHEGAVEMATIEQSDGDYPQRSTSPRRSSPCNKPRSTK